MKLVTQLCAVTAVVMCVSSSARAQEIPDQYVGFLDYGTTPWWLSYEAAERDGDLLRRYSSGHHGADSVENAASLVGKIMQRRASVPGGRSARNCYVNQRQKEFMHLSGAVEKMGLSALSAREGADWIVEGRIEDSEVGFASETIGTLFKIKVSKSLAIRGYMKEFLEDSYSEVPSTIFVFHPSAQIPGRGCFEDAIVLGRERVRVGDAVWVMLSLGGDPAVERAIAVREAEESGETYRPLTVNPSHAMFLVPELTAIFASSGNGVVATRNWRSEKTEQAGNAPSEFPNWLAQLGITCQRNPRNHVSEES